MRAQQRCKVKRQARQFQHQCPHAPLDQCSRVKTASCQAGQKLTGGKIDTHKRPQKKQSADSGQKLCHTKQGTVSPSKLQQTRNTGFPCFLCLRILCEHLLYVAHPSLITWHQFLYFPRMDMQDMGRTAQNQLRVMGHNQGAGCPIIGHTDHLHRPQQVFPVLSAGRLIIEHQPSFRTKSGSQRKSLLLTSGKGAGMPVFQAI